MTTDLKDDFCRLLSTCLPSSIHERIQATKAMSRGFSRGKQLVKTANSINYILYAKANWSHAKQRFRVSSNSRYYCLLQITHRYLGVLSVYTHVASICANLLEQKKAFTQEGFQIPQDWIGTPIWPPWRHVKTQYFFHNSEWYSKSISKHEGCINCVIQLLSGDVTRDDSQRQFFAQQNVGVLEQCCNLSKQCRSHVARLALR